MEKGYDYYEYYSRADRFGTVNVYTGEWNRSGPVWTTSPRWYHIEPFRVEPFHLERFRERLHLQLNRSGPVQNGSESVV